MSDLPSNKVVVALAIVSIVLGILMAWLVVPRVYAALLVTLPITVTNSSSSALEDDLLLVEVPTSRLETSEYLTEESTVVITNNIGNRVPAIAGLDTTTGQTDTTYWLIRGDAPAGGITTFNAEIGMDEEQSFLLPSGRTAGDITIPSGALRSGGYTTSTGLNVLVNADLDNEGAGGPVVKQGTAWEVRFRLPTTADGHHTYDYALDNLANTFTHHYYQFTPTNDMTITGVWGSAHTSGTRIGIVAKSQVGTASAYSWPSVTLEGTDLYTGFSADLTGGVTYYFFFDDTGRGIHWSKTSFTARVTTYGSYVIPSNSLVSTATDVDGNGQSYYQYEPFVYGVHIAGLNPGESLIQASGTGGDTLEADWDGSRATWWFRVNAGGATSSLLSQDSDGSWTTEDSATNITLTASSADVSVGTGLMGELGRVSIGAPDNADDLELDFAAGAVTVGLSSNVLSGTIENKGEQAADATWTVTLPSSITSRSNFSTSWNDLEFQENIHMRSDAIAGELPDLVGGVTAAGASTDDVTPGTTEDTFGIMGTLRTAGLDSGVADAWWLILANAVGVVLAAAFAKLWANLWVTLAIGLAVNLAAMEISGQIGPWVVVWYMLWSIPAVALYTRRTA